MKVREKLIVMSLLLVAVLLGLCGLLLSASFSGSEIAYYRMPRLRLKLDALEGDLTARQLLRLVNAPSTFVATILVGNNVANYAVSVATVLAVGAIFPHSQSGALEIGSTLLLAPLLFVYGEMFPKFLCLQAPNRMMRLLSPLVLFFYHLFLPLTSLLWFVSRFLGKLLGETREIVEPTLGRKELTGVLNEGRQTGILFDAQRRLASGVFDISDRRISDWALPPSHWPVITTASRITEVLEIARKHNMSELPVYESESIEQYKLPAGTMPIGYLRAIDLEMAVRHQPEETSLQLQRLLRTELPIRSTVEISSRHTLLTGMILLQTLQGSFACIVGEQRECVGFVHADTLRDALCGKPQPNG